jgi:hypothetical protein
MNSNIDIYLTSPTIQKILQNILDSKNKTHSKFKTNKLPYQAEWLTILTIVAQKNQTVNAFNVQLQTNDPTPSVPLQIEISHNKLRCDTFYLQWNKTYITHLPRRFIRHIQNAENTATWCSQKRFDEINTNRQNIHWTTLFEYINYNNLPNTRATNSKYSNLKSFKIKFLLNELPTQQNLNKRNPKNYTNNLCFRCNLTIENNTHWWQCKQNKKKIQKLIEENTEILITKYQHPTADTTLQQTIKNINNLITKNLSENSNNQMHTIQGFIPVELHNLLQKTTEKKGKLKHSVTSLIFHKLCKKIYTEIWLPRCQSLNSENQNTKTPSPSNQDINITHITTLAKNIKIEKRLKLWSVNFSTHNLSPDDILNYID